MSLIPGSGSSLLQQQGINPSTSASLGTAIGHCSAQGVGKEVA